MSCDRVWEIAQSRNEEMWYHFISLAIALLKLTEVLVSAP